MKEPNIPEWTAGEPMPESAKESLKDKVRRLRKKEDAEVENAFIEKLYPLVQKFSSKERIRLLRQKERELMTDKHAPTELKAVRDALKAAVTALDNIKERIRLLRQKERELMTDKHAPRKGQKGQKEHAPTELKVVGDALIAAITALDNMNRTAAERLEQALLDRVGNLEELARFMPYKRLPDGRRQVIATLSTSWSGTGWYSLPESRDEVERYERPETPTLTNLCALLWAVVDIIDPSVSPSQWNAKEGLAEQASSPGATRKEAKQEFLIALGKLLWEAIGRPPGRKVLQDTAKLIFGDELSWDARKAAKLLKQKDLKKISPP